MSAFRMSENMVAYAKLAFGHSAEVTMYSPSASSFLSGSGVTNKGVMDFFVDISSSSSDYGNTTMSSQVSCISISAIIVTPGSPTFESPVAAEGLDDNSRESYE
ncbi:hypothetical protein VNO80_26849 [Phaseolus coccineus]|uniref:Uncharacterized protein n=1 Tax=Phaseolus coccineus TaxID=3886 RepID=A0AAN9LKK0_PHACN